MQIQTEISNDRAQSRPVDVLNPIEKCTSPRNVSANCLLLGLRAAGIPDHCDTYVPATRLKKGSAELLPESHNEAQAKALSQP